MNFEISEEISAVRDSLIRVLADHYTPSHRQAFEENKTAYAEHAWEEMAGLGLTALLVPQEYDGLGADFTDLLPILHELGRTLAPVPYVASCVQGVTALGAASDSGLRRKLLPSVADGSLHLSCASTFSISGSDVAAQFSDGRWRLEGLQRQMLYAATADRLVLIAKAGGAAGAQENVFLVDRREQGVHLRAYRLIDGTPAADVRLENVAATPLCAPDKARVHEVIEAIAVAGTAAACAEMVGAMEAALELTVEYLKTRRQFGRLIGENQALRHRVADMLVALEMSRSLSIAAAVAARPGGLDTESGRADLHRAKFLIGRNARSVCEAAIQLHGGIGMTEEYAVGHYLRRVHVLDQQFGAGSEHLKQLTRHGK